MPCLSSEEIARGDVLETQLMRRDLQARYVFKFPIILFSSFMSTALLIIDAIFLDIGVTSLKNILEKTCISMLSNAELNSPMVNFLVNS